MLCLINILTRVVNAYFFAVLLLANLAAGVVVIVYGAKIKEELAL